MCINYSTHFYFCGHDGEIEHRPCGNPQPDADHVQENSDDLDGWCFDCWSDPALTVKENIPDEFHEFLPDRLRYTNVLTAIWERLTRVNANLLLFIRNGPTGVLTANDRDWVADTFFKMQYDLAYRAITPDEEKPTVIEIKVMYHFWKALELYRIAQEEAPLPHTLVRRRDLLTMPVDPETIGDEEKVCVICYEPMGSTDATGSVRVMEFLTCDHMFCNLCITQVLESDPARCPLCRFYLPTIHEFNADNANEDAANSAEAVYPNSLWWVNLMRYGVNP